MSKQIGVLGGVLTAIAACAFVMSWSSGFIVAKFATVAVSMWTVLFWRYLLLSVVLVLISLVTGELRGASPGAVRRQLAVGFFSQFGYVVFVYASVVANVTSGTTALIDAVQPLIVATLVGPLLGLRVRGVQWFGLALGVIGVALVVVSQLEGAASSPLAYIFPLLAMLSLVTGTFVDRRYPSDLSILGTLTIHVGISAIAIIGLSFFTGAIAPPVTLEFWAIVLFAAGVPTLVAYGLYWWLIRRIGITSLNALLFAVAPTTAVAGAVAFGEALNAMTLIGFVISALALAIILVTDRGLCPRPGVEGPAAASGPNNHYAQK